MFSFAVPRGDTPLKVFLLHALSARIPIFVFLFLITGPHPAWMALLAVSVIVTEIWLDTRSRPDLHPPPEQLPEAPFTALLLVQTVVQLGSYWALGAFVYQAGAFSVSTVAAVILVGLGSGYASIVLAHELVHRKHPVLHGLGRLLMCTVLYEHFSTEHVRGHHKRVGTLEDPATARFGETYVAFFFRTVPGQFRSAWRLETRRLGQVDMAFLDRRQLRNRVLHGVITELVLLAGLTTLFGPVAFAAQLVQSVIAVNLLEAVNYFEHWGLQRSRTRITLADSWDAESGYTRYSLVGLSRHSDHHAHAQRPYQSLRHFDESPKLPMGYMALVFAVFFRNRWVREQLTAELERKQLGPFRPV